MPFLLEQHWLRLENYLRDGGMVMLPLVLVSLAMSLLIAERTFFCRRLRRGRLSRAAAWEHIRGSRLPAEQAGVMGLVVTRFLQRRGTERAQDRFVMDEAMAAVRGRLDAGLTLIGVLAAVAPLLGLLGTVTGMIATFDVLTLFGTGNPKAMAAGISEALITTETGLVVAIPGLYMKTFLDRWALDLHQDLEAVGCHLRRLLAAAPALAPDAAVDPPAAEIVEAAC